MRLTFRGLASVATLLSLLALAAPLWAAEVDLNSATQEELVALPGIGPAKAKAIIDYRTAHAVPLSGIVGAVGGVRAFLGDSRHTWGGSWVVVVSDRSLKLLSRSKRVVRPSATVQFHGRAGVPSAMLNIAVWLRKRTSPSARVTFHRPGIK